MEKVKLQIKSLWEKLIGKTSGKEDVVAQDDTVANKRFDIDNIEYLYSIIRNDLGAKSISYYSFPSYSGYAKYFRIDMPGFKNDLDYLMQLKEKIISYFGLNEKEIKEIIIGNNELEFKMKNNLSITIREGG